MAPQIFTRRLLEKMINENLIASFLTLQGNILLQQNVFLQRYRDIWKKLLEKTSKIDSLVMKNEELTSQLAVTQNTLKVLQVAFNSMSNKLEEIERQHHKLEQFSRREYLDFSGIPTSVSHRKT